MRVRKSQIRRRVQGVPEVKFEDNRLTSAAGLVLFQAVLDRLGLRSRLRRCFFHRRRGYSYGLAQVFLLLVIHILLGYRKLREMAYYRDDPMVHRVLGWSQLPTVSTLSRRLSSVDPESMTRVCDLGREMVLTRLSSEALGRVTLDFDGTVCSTRRSAEGSAVGFNRKRKGTRSYYPLLCTVAQTGQVLDVLHRSGNVHDYNGAPAFIGTCIGAVQEGVEGVQVEARMDAAFCSEELAGLLESLDVEYSISVSFGSAPHMKEVIESRQRWHRLNEDWSYFETPWKPKKWRHRRRLLVCRQSVHRQRKGALQTDLFEPVEWSYQYKLILTNKTQEAGTVLRFHNGRGSQEGLIGEVKDLCQMDYIPSRTWLGNQLYMQAGFFAHNLSRELQMHTKPRERHTSRQRRTLWPFEKLSTLRHLVLLRAGRLTNRSGRQILTLSANEAVRKDFVEALSAYRTAA